MLVTIILSKGFTGFDRCLLCAIGIHAPQDQNIWLTQTYFLRHGYIASQTLHKLMICKTVQNLWRMFAEQFIERQNWTWAANDGKKSEKMVYLFQYLSAAAHFPILNCYFLRTLVISDYAYLKVSSFCPSSLQRISALEEFSIPSRRKTKPKFSGLFHLGVELQSNRKTFSCKPIYGNGLKLTVV